ncbi:uncharacterized protein LOC126372111 isoform X2 [Pectinophora gossypiella]|uniref:uncharacterized protein LOC126372111 isoform X2 n=1 Tax=Pectinophora gossypiella TaxID=13191 RepID=UPI00214E40FA|nr:uncharacterized protein LOC126372111 isoform X2 [Pectinophora gossypiella]
MNDPWDVKAVRQGDQYQSCMKLNGVPLLPPVLSKECRKEMQYYKLLAKEVEKRISILKPYVEQDIDSSEEKTDAPELPECEQNEPERPIEEIETEFGIIINKASTGSEDISETSELFSPLNDKYHYKISHIEASKLVIDLDLPVEEREKELYNTLPKTPHHTLETDELPERDCNNTYVQKELLTEFETCRKDTKQKDTSEDISRLEFSLPLDSEFIALHHDGPSSLSTKSFTGSLHDLHSDSAKESEVPPLIRQRSYTVLKPSPQLLAHLEVQSANTGIDVHSISMSESKSNVSMHNKKRRSWDLETAKVKWSSMALELKKSTANGASSNHSNKNISKKAPQITPTTTSLKSQNQEKARKANLNQRAPKSDPVQRAKKIQSPVRHSSEKTTIKDNGKQPTSKTAMKNSPTKSSASNKEDKLVKESTTTLISGSDDPAGKVRELYEKLQKQQMLQMTSLIDKQKREQQLLQQVFEEQNNILLKQLKTVCPKTAIEAKQAWGDLKEDSNRGPVSLSQLINNKTPEQSAPQSPVSKTLTETNNYINKCDNVLKKSRDITNNIKTPPSKTRTATAANRSQKKTLETLQSPQKEVNRTRPGSPNFRNSSRRLNYETSASSDYEASGVGRDYEPISTDRTNDTMADLNVTFPSDSSDECLSLMQANRAAAERRKAAGRPNSPIRMKINLDGTRPANVTLKNLEESIHSSMNSICSRPQKTGAICRTTTSEERVAASKIVAYAKGYLVRRLMRTERVQGTVQTIRDALMCALQLHQDRAGIRGADVDLHRRLIQQITAACYSLHDTFIASSPAERCALIAADRNRRQALAARLPTPRSTRRTDF